MIFAACLEFLNWPKWCALMPKLTDLLFPQANINICDQRFQVQFLLSFKVFAVSSLCVDLAIYQQRAERIRQIYIAERHRCTWGHCVMTFKPFNVAAHFAKGMSDFMSEFFSVVR